MPLVARQTEIQVWMLFILRNVISWKMKISVCCSNWHQIRPAEQLPENVLQLYRDQREHMFSDLPRVGARVRRICHPCNCRLLGDATIKGKGHGWLERLTPETTVTLPMGIESTRRTQQKLVTQRGRRVTIKWGTRDQMVKVVMV